MQEFGDASSPLQWFDRPELSRPIVLAAFEGWNDAGEAASTTIDHLIDQWDAQLFAQIDAENFFDFTATRPMVELTDGGERRIVWPTTDFWAATMPGTDQGVILVRGIEPQLQWRTFTEFIGEVATTYDASIFVTLGALLADVPHTRTTVVYGSSDSPELAEQHDLQRSSYEGPTGIVGVLHSMAAGVGLSTASLWATVPTYVPGASSPKAALALVERLASVVGTAIDVEDLQLEADEYVRQVSEFVEEDEDTAAYVAELERHYDANQDASPDDLVAEVEQFLRDQSN